MFEFWASLEMNFTRKTCTLEAETSVSGLTLCRVFSNVDKKYTFSGMTFLRSRSKVYSLFNNRVSESRLTISIG